MVPGRKFVRQGTLIVWSVKQKKRQPNQVFLFSDLLVVAKSTGTRTTHARHARTRTTHAQDATLSAALNDTCAGSGLAALKRKKPMAAEKDLKFRASFQLKYLVPRSIPDDPSAFLFSRLFVCVRVRPGVCACSDAATHTLCTQRTSTASGWTLSSVSR